MFISDCEIIQVLEASIQNVGYPEFHIVEDLPVSFQRVIHMYDRMTSYVRFGFIENAEGGTRKWWLSGYSAKHPEAVLFDTQILTQP